MEFFLKSLIYFIGVLFISCSIGTLIHPAYGCLSFGIGAVLYSLAVSTSKHFR